MGPDVSMEPVYIFMDSMSMNLEIFKMKARRLFETSGTIYAAKERHIPEELIGFSYVPHKPF